MLKATKDGQVLLLRISPNASKNEIIKTSDGIKVKIRDAKAERTGGLQKRLQLRMQQRLAHDVQIQIVCIRPEFSCQQAKFLCRQRAGRKFRFRAEAACKVAAVCDFKIAAGKAHGRLLFVSVFLLYHTGGPLNSRRDCGIMKKE